MSKRAGGFRGQEGLRFPAIFFRCHYQSYRAGHAGLIRPVAQSDFLLYIYIVFILCLFTAGDPPVNVENIPDIAGNIPDIAGNDADIAGNDADIAGNNADIAGNIPDIAGNDADIAGNIPDIAGNDADIAGNNSGIAGNDAGIAGNNSGIAGNNSGIADDDPVIKDVMRVRLRQELLRDKRIRYDAHKRVEKERKKQSQSEGKEYVKQPFKYEGTARSKEERGKRFWKHVPETVAKHL
ncbi:MAG: hypothetical protein LBB90_06545 [Tannerella sp.]|jgi:hypothetical protein|nr:hypothetical protein [Tannerella sp.]